MATWRDVIEGAGRASCQTSPALPFLQSLPDRAVSLVMFSPHYEDQRTYGAGIKVRGQAWVDELRPIVAEAARVSSGLVVVNAAGPVRERSYSPTMEWLVADLTRLDGLVCGPAPWAWHKVCGIPGSGGKDYQRRDWEPLYAFCLPDRLPLVWSDNTAFGKPPKFGVGGEMSNRARNGDRVNGKGNPANKWGGGGTSLGRKADGTKLTARPGCFDYSKPPIANPGNVIRARVGGRHLGSPLAHENEAPMPLAVAERFVCWYAAPDSVVLDPFSGSGTTAHAAILHGRRFIGCDLRESQSALTLRRLRTVTPNLVPA
jgi:hypothetical protein